MKLLALDTSGDACSAALLVDGLIISRYELAPRRHAEIVLPMFDELLQEAGATIAQLDAVAVGVGPGAFTGLRIAVGVVQGLAFAHDLPVVPISTLTALAQRGWREQGAQQVLAGFDARLQEVYWSACRLNEHEIMVAIDDEQVCRPEEVPVPDSGSWLGLGSAWLTYSEVLAPRLGEYCQQWLDDRGPHAHDIAMLGHQAFLAGRAVTAEQVLPVYLRNNVARKSQPRGL
jgi:tRNA threonylcarbamoyladenosine biosynthesis protein TsaB